MLDITNTYPNGYTYLSVCPSCGGKNTLSFNLKYKSVKCWKANCELHQKTTLYTFATRYSLVQAFEDFYGTKLKNLGEQHNVSFQPEVTNRTVNQEEFWEAYVPFEDFKTKSNTLNYLQRRGISLENIQRFQLGRTKSDNGVIIPFYKYQSEGAIKAELEYYQIRFTTATKYQPKYFNPIATDKKIFNLYSMFNNSIRFGVEGVFDVLYFGDTFFAILGSDFGDSTIEQLLKYIDYQKKFNTVLELSFIPDLGIKNYEYWRYCLKLFKQHTDTKISIVDLAEGANFPKTINDGQSIANGFEGGGAFVQHRISKRKTVKLRNKNYYFSEKIL